MTALHNDVLDNDDTYVRLGLCSSAARPMTGPGLYHTGQP
jgi:hypothetical protein